MKFVTVSETFVTVSDERQTCLKKLQFRIKPTAILKSLAAVFNQKTNFVVVRYQSVNNGTPVE